MSIMMTKTHWTATDFMTDMIRHKKGSVKGKAELLEKWRNHQWSSQEMRNWANWQWRNMIG